MFTFLLVLHAIIAALLVTVILMQRSEGGGLTSGGSPAGLMSARGTADFLTRATTVLATLFVVVAIVLAIIASVGHSTKIDASQVQRAPVTTPDQPTAPPVGGLGAGTQAALAGSNAAAPVSNSAVPLAK